MVFAGVIPGAIDLTRWILASRFLCRSNLRGWERPLESLIAEVAQVGIQNLLGTRR